MQTSDWISTAIAGVALVVSIWTAVAAYVRNRREARTANLGVYFHWNREKSRVDLPNGKIHVGYNLIIWNQGPATAFEVNLRSGGREPARYAFRASTMTSSHSHRHVGRPTCGMTERG